MRIALVSHDFVRNDGQGRVSYELVRGALARGHDVLLLADHVEPDLVEHGAEWHPLHPRFQRPQLFKDRDFARRASEAIRRVRHRVDIIHANGYTLTVPHHVNTAHFVHAAWLRSPVRRLTQGRGIRSLYQWAYTCANTTWERSAFAQAEIVVGVSEQVRGELLAVGVPPEKVRVISNGVDLDEFRPGAVDRASIGLPPAGPLALFVGALRTGRKNLDTLLHALARLPELQLAVVGDVEGSPYPQLARELGLAQRVTFLGFRRDVATLMRAVDVLVCPSRYEPFSLVVLEAMAAGLPVVTTRTVGAACLVTPECGVVLDDPDNVETLAAALRPFALSHPRCRDMRLRARAVAERHGWAQMAMSYLTLYETLSAATENTGPIAAGGRA